MANSKDDRRFLKINDRGSVYYVCVSKITSITELSNGGCVIHTTEENAPIKVMTLTAADVIASCGFEVVTAKGA